MATLSDGTVIAGPKALRKHLKKLKRLSRAHSRKVKGSANRLEILYATARLHAHIANIRSDSVHKATTQIVRKFSIIGIEDLNVRGMMANGKLSRAIADIGMFEFRRQLDYKALMQAARLVVADRWFPSSKMCNCCEAIHSSLALSDRSWTCTECGVVHDRDHNASNNLKDMAASSAVTACGATRSGHDLAVRTKRVAVKQEPKREIFAHA